MKKYFALIGAALIVALTVSPAFAAGQTGQSSKMGQATQSQLNQRQMGQIQPQMGQPGQLSNAFLANELMDKKVVSMRQNEPLGTVQNLVIDPNGFVAYILLEPAKGMKESGQLIAVPWDAAHPTIHNNQVELFLSKQQIQNAPTISKNNLAQLQNPQWEQQNFAYFGMGYMPQQGYEMPQQGYGMPQQGQGMMMPQQGYGMPQQGYGMPQQGYGMPQQGYGDEEGYSY
jgi:sporulation protein YlmC with PRC-barrel domain